MTADERQPRSIQPEFLRFDPTWQQRLQDIRVMLPSTVIITRADGAVGVGF